MDLSEHKVARVFAPRWAETALSMSLLVIARGSSMPTLAHSDRTGWTRLT
ncbi:hypothetical protein ACIRD4_32695 [Streptomyces clavifer]